MKVLEGCKKLESLHISGHFEDSEKFLVDLMKYLPLATNLRDLRIQKDAFSVSLLKDLISSLESCLKLERLMIYQAEIGFPLNGRHQFNICLSRCLKDLIHRLPQIVAFCYIYPFDPENFGHIFHPYSISWDPKNTENVTHRPCFWHYVGPFNLPKNLSFPRIHLHEFVDPFPYIDSFPVFKLF
jgi:hypothetical protein